VGQAESRRRLLTSGYIANRSQDRGEGALFALEVFRTQAHAIILYLLQHLKPAEMDVWMDFMFVQSCPLVGGHA